MPTSNHTIKTCKSCGTPFPSTPEYFYRTKSNKDGLKGICKSCANAEHYRYTKGFRKTEILPEGLRRCQKCKEIKPATVQYFYRDDNAIGLTARCKDCIAIDQKQWREANLDYIHEVRKRQYWSDPEAYKSKTREYALENREERRRKDREYYQNNKQRWPEYYKTHPRDPEKERERLRIKDHNNPESKRIRSARRRALLRNAEGTHTKAELTQLFEDQNGLCGYCGVRLYWSIRRDIHIDHITPLARGGSNWISNIIIACSGCNLNKHNRTLPEWEKIRGW